MFDLEADAGQRRRDLGERSIGLKMVLEPGKGEFHQDPIGDALYAALLVAVSILKASPGWMAVIAITPRLRSS